MTDSVIQTKFLLIIMLLDKESPYLTLGLAVTVKIAFFYDLLQGKMRVQIVVLQV